MEPSTRRRPSSLSQRFCAGLLFLFIFEAVFGGALGLQPAGIPIRKLLMLALLLAFAGNMLTRYRFSGPQLGLLTLLPAAMLGWGVIMPLAYGTDFSHSVAEMTPLLGLLLIFPMILAIRTHGADRYLRFTNNCVAAVAVLVVGTWALANYFNFPEFAFGLKLLFVQISGDDFGIYIGYMPDGSFRVMWITCLLFPMMLIYKNFNKFSPGWTAFYMLAIYATGTRSFLYVAVIALCVLLLRRRPVFALAVLPVMVAVILVGLQSVEDVRIFQVSSELDADSPRSEQFFSLMRLFGDHPFLGAGFGSHADILRSEEAPYSYELTYVALLAKLGAAGITVVFLAVLACVQAAMRRHRDKAVEIGLLVFSFIAITASNPYLLNSVGISMVSFMLAAAFARPGRRRQRASHADASFRGVR